MEKRRKKLMKSFSESLGDVFEKDLKWNVSSGVQKGSVFLLRKVPWQSCNLLGTRRLKAQARKLRT